MSSTDTSLIESEDEQRFWEQGNSDISNNSNTSLLIEATAYFSQIFTPFHSLVNTSDLNSPIVEISLSSQESTHFLPSLPTSILRERRGRPCRGDKFSRRPKYKKEIVPISLDDPSDTLPPKPKRIQYTKSRYGLLLDMHHHSIIERRRLISTHLMAFSP